MPQARAVRHALAVATARIAVTLSLWWGGFRAVSDDDYSRVTIAARFAHHPSPDPSGTSWLPVPFWLYGVPMALFGDSLSVARAVALALGAASSVLVWLAARLLGYSERAALLGALGAVVLPYGSWLSAATVPEAPTAALLVFGSVSLVRPEPRLRLWGALALATACFSRYEAWAPTLLFAALTAKDAQRARDKWLWVACGLSLSSIALWLLHGAVRHGDALFFVARVRGYHAALAGGSSTDWSALWQTPWALVRFEPELFAVAAVALGLSLRHGSPFGPTAWRPLALLLVLVAFLAVAGATGGSATHHPERSLLPVFWFVALLAAGLVARLAEADEHPWRLPALAAPLALAASLLLRPNVRATFIDRSEEEQVGSVLRRLGARDVALDTDDYGYFAIQAALGHGKSFALDERDPRKPARSRPATPDELAARLASAPSQPPGGAQPRWLVTPRSREPLARPLGALRLTTPHLSVIELRAIEAAP